jgi:PAS domain S-box-containing protein
MNVSVGGIAIVLLNRRGVIQYWSPGAEELFGYRAEDATGALMDLIIPEHLRERHWNGWRKAWASGQIREGLTALIPVRCADGEVRHFAGRLQPVRSAHGELVAAMGIWSPADLRDKDLYVLG